MFPGTGRPRRPKRDAWFSTRLISSDEEWCGCVEDGDEEEIQEVYNCVLQVPLYSDGMEYHLRCSECGHETTTWLEG